MTRKFVKDSSVDSLVKKLSVSFGNEIQFIDYWEADLCAIGISSERKKDYLIYVLTYEQPAGKFAIHVDKTEKGIALGFRTVEEHESIDLNALSKIIVKYLDIRKIS